MTELEAIRFIHSEKLAGKSPETIVTKLVNEGWEKTTAQKFVSDALMQPLTNATALTDSHNHFHLHRKHTFIAIAILISTIILGLFGATLFSSRSTITPPNRLPPTPTHTTTQAAYLPDISTMLSFIENPSEISWTASISATVTNCQSWIHNEVNVATNSSYKKLVISNPTDCPNNPYTSTYIENYTLPDITLTRYAPDSEFVSSPPPVFPFSISDMFLPSSKQILSTPKINSLGFIELTTQVDTETLQGNYVFIVRPVSYRPYMITLDVKNTKNSSPIHYNGNIEFAAQPRPVPKPY